jgi:hypothetical protein
MFCLQREFAVATNMAIKFYNEDIPQEADRSLAKM